MAASYEPYQPTKWQRRIDAAFGFVSPAAELKRMVDREKAHWFRYLAAQPTSARRNSSSTTPGEWLKVQREKLQIMWNAITMVDNSGLCTGILTKFPTYICGTLRWQARTGDKNVNTQYQQYIQDKVSKPSNIDLTRRYSLRQQCILDIKSIALKGDVGTNIVRGDDKELYLQGIEADRIGDPYRWDTSERYVRGLELDKFGGITGVRVYHQEKRSGLYKYDDTYPTRDPKTGLPTFLFFTNPIDYDNYRGVSLFKHAIDNDTYISRMREYELQALLWASSQSGVYYTKSGGLPESLPFSRTPLIDSQGNTIDTYQTRPNTISALSADGERVEMFQHDRPSPNVIGMYQNTVIDICNGAGLTVGFGYNMTGLTGPAVRQCSAQDARAIQIWQEMLREQKLDPVVMLLLGDAIAKGDLPYHPNWMLWDWFFPAKPTIDVGRESEANIEEIGAGINTGKQVTMEAGLGDIQDVTTQLSHEVEMRIEAAMEVAKRQKLEWEQVYALMIPPPRGRNQGGMVGAAKIAAGKVAGQNGDKAGATDNGVDIGESGNGNGQNFSLKKNEDRCLSISTDQGDIEIFYSPDQPRQPAGSPEGGQFAPEGGGVSGGGGVAIKEAPSRVASPAEKPASITVDNIEQHRGGIKSDELAKHKDDIDGAYNRTADTKIVPTHSLISNKNEQLDPKFVSGEKADPRQRATDKMVEAIKGGSKRDPIEVHDNMDGTFTIKDGNASSQAAMLAGWTKLPVRITSESPEPEMSDVEKALVDYKPGERPLTGEGTERIQDKLANTRFVPYDKTRFFNGVNEMMDATKLTGVAYKEARDRFFNQLPVEHVPMDQLVVTQRRINTAKVNSISKGDLNDPKGALGSAIQAVRYKGETYVLNGHHRAIARALRGANTIKANLLDLGDKDLTPSEVKAYGWAARTKPQADEMMRQIGFAHGAAVKLAQLKSLGGRGGAREKVNAPEAEGPAGGYAGDWSKIKDLIRGRIMAKDWTGVREVVDDLKQKFPNVPVKYTPPDKAAGFSDYKLYPVVNGGKVEISVTTRGMDVASDATHPLYKRNQTVTRNANNERRMLTPAELAEVTENNNKMHQIFAGAYS